MRQMLDTTSIATALAPKLSNAIEGPTIDKPIKVQQPIAAKTKDADEDVSDGDLREAPRLDGNLDGVVLAQPFHAQMIALVMVSAQPNVNACKVSLKRLPCWCLQW